MNKKVIITGIVALALGLGIGYAVAGSKAPEKAQAPMGMHQMPDGSMMSNGGQQPMSMEGMMADMNAALRGKTGDAFDQAFISEMIVHHQGAVDMAKLALTNAKHQEIKDLANAIITAQEKEISQMQSWQKSWYGQ